MPRQPARNERGSQIGGGWDPQWHQPTDFFATYSDKDFRLGLNAAQTDARAVAQLTGATLKKYQLPSSHCGPPANSRKPEAGSRKPDASTPRTRRPGSSRATAHRARPTRSTGWLPRARACWRGGSATSRSRASRRRSGRCAGAPTAWIFMHSSHSCFFGRVTVSMALMWEEAFRSSSRLVSWSRSRQAAIPPRQRRPGFVGGSGRTAGMIRRRRASADRVVRGRSTGSPSIRLPVALRRPVRVPSIPRARARV